MHPAPCTQRPAPSTQHPAPCTLHPAPSTLHPAPSTLHPAPSTLHRGVADAEGEGVAAGVEVHGEGPGRADWVALDPSEYVAAREREFVIDNLLVRINFIIVMIW